MSTYVGVSNLCFRIAQLSFGLQNSIKIHVSGWLWAPEGYKDRRNEQEKEVEETWSGHVATPREFCNYVFSERLRFWPSIAFFPPRRHYYTNSEGLGSLGMCVYIYIDGCAPRHPPPRSPQCVMCMYI